MITNINPTSPFVSVFKYQEQHGESASIGLSNEGEAIMSWARNKMMEEQRIQELARTNPTVADAADAVMTAQEQLRMVVALVK